MSVDQDGWKWVSVSSGTGPTAVKRLCVCMRNIFGMFESGCACRCCPIITEHVFISSKCLCLWRPWFTQIMVNLADFLCVSYFFSLNKVKIFHICFKCTYTICILFHLNKIMKNLCRLYFYYISSYVWCKAVKAVQCMHLFSLVLHYWSCTCILISHTGQDFRKIVTTFDQENSIC